MRKYKARNHFDPSSKELVSSEDLVKILRGQEIGRASCRERV